MNFKMKFLVGAALATMALSSAANAALVDTQTGNSSLILTLIDSTDAVSATFDLGFTKSTFDQTSSYSWNLTASNYAAAYNSFFAAVTNTANVTYAIFAGDSTGTAVGDNSLFTTVASTWTTITGSKLVSTLRGFDNYIDANAQSGDFVTGVTDAAFRTQATGGTAYAGAAYDAAGKTFGSGGSAAIAYGTNGSVYNIVRASTNNIANTTATKLTVNGVNPYFSLGTDGTLSYVAAAPVPEADTWAMLLGGFALMGFIARRRTSFEVV